jgi:SAM-dependent methyltransferase
VLTRILAHPATRGLDLDDPKTTALRRQIVCSKPFLKRVYEEWYDLIVDRLPTGDDEILELGSGGGFLDSRLPDLLTSDVFPVPGVERVIDARDLPFSDSTLRGIVMVNVLHHIPDVESFFSEAQRTIRPGGRIVMVEPWNTRWSRFVHEKWHNEPYRPESETWSFPESGPLSGANAALPWIVFERDRDRFASEWPSLRVAEVHRLMALRYIASGGVSLRSLQPGWAYPVWKRFEMMTGIDRAMSVFALIVIDRI